MAELGPPAPAPATPLDGASVQVVEPPNGAPVQSLPTDSLGKRQRRPSVRLGEIGDQTAFLSYETSARRSKAWRMPKVSHKSSKTRPLTNLVHNGDCHEALELDAVERNFSGEEHSEFGSRKLSGKKGTVRRARTSWSSKTEYADEDEEKFGSRDDNNNDAFEAAASDSPLKDRSPVHSIDNQTLSFWNRRPVRTRISDNDAIELETMRESNSSADGVRDWLIGLGLGRYAPVFEIHEVDDEVLPLLTLEDLKDMGINAVGSRRKMNTSIQKLRKGFS